MPVPCNDKTPGDIGIVHYLLSGRDHLKRGLIEADEVDLTVEIKPEVAEGFSKVFLNEKEGVNCPSRGKEYVTDCFL